MDFSIGNLVKGVVGAVAKVANAVVNKLSPVAKGGGILGGIAGAIVGVAEAVLGVTAEFANACEDGEIDDEEAEELLQDVFKLLVGAFIGMFGSSGSGSNSIDRKSEVLDEGTINTGKNLYTLQEANEYINCNIWGFDMGHKVYLSNQVSSLPEQITYKSGGYTYVYELQECPPSTFNGIELPSCEDIVFDDGTILSSKSYRYGLVYTDEPKGPELTIQIMPILPGKGFALGETIPPKKLLGTEHAKIENPRGSLNEKIPRSKTANKNIRLTQRLTREEKRIANQHLDDLMARRKGDTVAASRLSKYREHQLENLSNTGGDNFEGWTSLDLSDTNNVNNIMRLIYREVSNGIEWKVIQQH
ncbi:hypothetical protein [Clostridium sp. ZBS2]|uniref:hypothetical protein n=1 Tax=Clostridium sp. ZBS2 TaxID=2949976 RepID=UPI002079905A|nr:hypothetical protein [Clostridium sp. ZBS2]